MKLKEIWSNLWNALNSKGPGFSIKKTMGALSLTVILALTCVYVKSFADLVTITPMWQGFIIALIITRAYEKKISNEITPGN